MHPNHEELEEIQQKLNAIQYALSRITLQVQKLLKKRSRRELLYQHARAMIGREASPDDLASDELGCAESVSNIIRKVIKIPIVTGTWTLNDLLKLHLQFRRTDDPTRRGTIIISPTGTGNGSIRGHVGILGENGNIMSNSSATGLWTQNFTLEGWQRRYSLIGGLETHYYVPL